MSRKNKVGVPVILQMEMAECGSASLAMVLAYFGRWVSLEELRVSCGISRDGSKAGNLYRAASQYGLVPHAYSLEPEELKAYPLPMILHWELNHFVVLTGWNSKYFFLNDPAHGPRKVSREDFSKSFTGVVINFEKGEDFVKGGHRPSLVTSLVKQLKNSKLLVFLIFLLGFMLVVPQLIQVTLTRVFFEEVLVKEYYFWVKPICTGMIATGLFIGVIAVFQQFMLNELMAKMNLSMAVRFVYHLFRLPMEFFSQRSPGDIQNRTNPSDIISLVCNGLALNLVNAVVVIFYLVLLFQYSVALTFIGVAVCVINILVLLLAAKIRSNQSLALNQHESKFMGMFMGGLQLMESIRAQGHETDFIPMLSAYQAKSVNSSQQIERSSLVLSSISAFLIALNSVLVLSLGAWEIMLGTFSIGMLVAYQALVQMFLQPVNQLTSMSLSIQELKGSMNRLEDVFNQKEDKQFSYPEAVSSEKLPAGRLEGKIELKDITFGYSKLAEPLIRDFNLTILPGQRVAVVGSSGSGKSTVAKLVTGLYSPWSGQILFDGKEKKDIPRNLFCSSISFVDQDIYLFDGTVRDNLSMWNGLISDEDIQQAARDACIHDDISSRSNGYQGIIDENGRNWSGGQRQRLEIARSLAVNPSLLIMDEATSALDTETELYIDYNIRRRGITCLIIAHRLSTIRDSDQIIVLDKGLISQRGTHDELIKDKNGIYYRLVNPEGKENSLS